MSQLDELRPDHVWGKSPVEPLDLDHAAIISRGADWNQSQTHAGHQGQVIPFTLFPWLGLTHP